MHANSVAIVFIVWGLIVVLFYRFWAALAVFWREMTWFGTTTQRRQEIFCLAVGTVLVGIGVASLFVGP